MWYALVHDEQLGPMPDTELAELHGQGVISDDTLVWTATMSDWRPVREVPEIQLLLAEPDLIDEEEGEGATMMMAPGDADWAAMLKAPMPAPEMPAVSVSHEPAEDARTEMLSPDMLPPELQQQPAPGLLAPQTPAAPPLPDFGAPEPGTGSIIDRFPDAPPVPEAEPDEPVFAPIEPASPPAESKRSKLPLILLLLLLIGGGAAAFILLGGDKTDPAGDPIANATDAPRTPATSASVAADTTPPPVKDAGVPDAGPQVDAMIIALDDLEPEAPPSVAPASKDAPTSVASNAPKSVPSKAAPASAKSKAPPSVAKATPPSRRRVTRPPKRSPETRKPREPRKPRTPVKEKPAKGDADLPVQLSRSHITSVLRRSGGALRSCASLDEKVKDGTFSVNVVIKRSGVVHSAKVITARLRKSPAAKCIEGQVKRFRFGRFKGDPMRIQLPFRL